MEKKTYVDIQMGHIYSTPQLPGFQLVFFLGCYESESNLKMDTHLHGQFSRSDCHIASYSSEMYSEVLVWLVVSTP